MNEVIQFLEKNPVQYLGTVGTDGTAKIRLFMFCFEQDSKLWFCTNNQKDVYKDIRANPNVELTVSSPEYAWIRLNGKAVFENNMAVKEGCMKNPIVQGQYQTADNPIFEVFYLEDAKAVIADFSGNLPKEYNMSVQNTRPEQTQPKPQSQPQSLSNAQADAPKKSFWQRLFGSK